MTEEFPSSILRAFQAAPHVPAFEHDARSITRGEILGVVARMVGGLTRAGLEPGDSIALVTGVTPEAFAAQIAGHVLGLRIVAPKPGISASELSLILSNVGVLVTDESPTAGLPSAPISKKVLHLSTLPADPMPLIPRGQLEHVALVIYTSGSTGEPKGVEYTYASLASSWQWNPSIWDNDTRRLAARYGRYLLFGTLASAVMFEHLGLCLMGGGTAVIPTTLPPAFGIPYVLVQLRISAVLFTVPRWNAVLDILRYEAVDLSCLESVVIAGSPLPAHLLGEARAYLGGAAHQAYGTNETGMLCLLSAEDMAAFPGTMEGSVGRAWAGVELSVRDDDGSEVPPRTVGQVWARTPGQFRSYTNESTEEVLGGDRFFCTRDRGFLDEDGFLYLAGRTRDVVIVNAVVHYAAAIEGALAAHRDVDAAYVVGVPDESTGESVVAFVVPADRRAQVLDLDALCGTVEQKLGKGAVPARIVAVDKVPLLPSGKPDKQALLKQT